MHLLIIWTAQYLLYAMVAAFALVWLVAEDRRGKLEVAAGSVIGLLVLLGLMYLARLHHDPRPFVQNPHDVPLFGHSRDDGFPSDHSLAAGLIATLVFFRHRVAGILLAAAAVAIAWARVAAHVHHLEDVVAGLLLGVVAGAVATMVVRFGAARVRSRRDGTAARHRQPDRQLV